MRRLLTLSGLLIGVLFTVSATAFDAGIDYQLIDPPQPTSSGEKIEVVDVFWYGCPACNAFKPFMGRWLEALPEDVVVVRMPASFGRADWQLHARAFYTAEALGILDTFHPAMFDAIHSQRKNLSTERALAAFFVEQGVERDRFTQTFNSFSVQSKARRAESMTARYGVDGVPTVIVDGRYRSSGTLAGGINRITDVLDHMIEQVRAERAASE